MADISTRPAIGPVDVPLFLTGLALPIGWPGTMCAGRMACLAYGVPGHRRLHVGETLTIREYLIDLELDQLSVP
jgi:hypothetical protein